MPRRREAGDPSADDYARGLSYLAAAKRVVAIAKKLDPGEAEILRRAADGLTERGLGMVIRGARELSTALKAAHTGRAGE